MHWPEPGEEQPDLRGKFWFRAFEGRKGGEKGPGAGKKAGRRQKREPGDGEGGWRK